MQTIRLTRSEAHRFLLTTFALNRWQSLSSVPEAIERLEFVQEDSIDVCGRMHELILWPRVRNYAPQKLHAALYGEGAHAFEHYLPNLSALPLSDHPHFLRRMRERAATPGRWGGLFDEEKPIAEKFLRAVDEAGPQKTRAQGREDGHMRSGWGTRTTVISQVVEKLWLTGTLSIARRDGFERVFDRTERVYPGVFEAELPEKTESERYLARKRLRARGLFRVGRNDLALLGKDAFIKVEIDGLSKPWHLLKESVPEVFPEPGDDVFLLAPLDPLVYDRQRTRELFDFDYTWEVYTPEAKRRWGYYVLPILQGERLIGRVEPKIDRKSGVLDVRSLAFEEGRPAQTLRRQVETRLEELAAFLGAAQGVRMP
jgi:hypothetical protein